MRNVQRCVAHVLLEGSGFHREYGIAMRCQDVACGLQAHTGTGKTIAFLLPALQRLLAEEDSLKAHLESLGITWMHGEVCAQSPMIPCASLVTLVCWVEARKKVSGALKQAAQGRKGEI